MTSDFKFSNIAELVLEIFLLFFFSSFLLVLGSDQPDQVHFRMIYGAFLAAAFCLFDRGRSLSILIRCPAMWILSVFLVFEGLRVILKGPSFFPLGWIYIALYFAVSYVFFDRKEKVRRLGEVLAWTAAFIAMNAIPALFQHREKAYYLLENGDKVFFYPFFYFQDWVSKYLLGIFAHSNYTGDVMALGFFPALGLGIYALFQYGERKREGSQNSFGIISYFALRFVLALVIAFALFLFFSRGSMTTFLLALGIFSIGFLIKYPSPARVSVVAALGVVFFILLAWGGNLKDAWKEMRTLQTEEEALQKKATEETYQNKSINYVREGIRRSLAIYRDHPVWGVGPGRYREVSQQYEDPSLGKVDPLVNFQSMSHYAQLLAEEGIGAYLYFLFLGVCLLEAAWRLIRTQSRFKFLMGLSFLAPVWMISIHASFNQLMEQFALMMPFHMVLGASLAVLRPDFKRE